MLKCPPSWHTLSKGERAERPSIGSRKPGPPPPEERCGKIRRGFDFFCGGKFSARSGIAAVRSGPRARSRATSTGLSSRRVRLRGFKLLQAFRAFGTHDGDPDKYGPFDRARTEQLEGLLGGPQTVAVPQTQEDSGARHRERRSVDAISGGWQLGSPRHVGTTRGRRHDQPDPPPWRYRRTAGRCPRRRLPGHPQPRFLG